MESDRTELTALLANLATQMRTTLSNLYLAAAQLTPPQAREKDPLMDKRAAVFDQNYYRLLRLVTNLSAAEYLNEEKTLTLQDGDFVDLIRTQCELASDLAELKQIDLRFVCAMESRVCAMSPHSIEQLFYHLLSNAIKFTPAGGTITVEVKKSGNRLLLSVSDTGCGISKERMDTLFCQYQDPDGPLTPPPHGMGLGLALCRRIAQLHDGSLLVESTEGSGSRFTLSLPDRQLGTTVSDVPFLYTGGFSPVLLGLADALPTEAFLTRNQD